MNGTDFVVFSLGSNDPLAEKIAKKLRVPLGKIALKTFADGEQHVQLLENVRGRSVYFIQPTNPPAENWVRLFLALDAAHGASAKEITAVLPYVGYARQERKSKPREPISARVFSVILEKLGATHVLAVDLHTDSIGGFYRKANVDYLYARPMLISHFQKAFKKQIAKDELVIVSPDIGGAARAQSYAKRLTKNANLALIHKEREQANQIARMRLVGDVHGKTALIVDDMADTCGTLARAAEVLMENGAKEVYACATHGLLSRNASAVIDASPIKKLFITDTINHNPAALSKKIEVISIANLLADAIYRINHDQSLSALFESK
ncbi:MAG: ribose-phosphate diphosphokinase [Patescibacteria group bacterium]|nr:ribose-phosphate diphosphokinase [Patescibacteria group bacterium]